MYFKRHSLVVRFTHWLNVLCFICLLMSGLQIFSAYPRLNIGIYGADADPAIMEIGSVQQEDKLHGYLQVGSMRISTTGVLGVSNEDGEPTPRAFPAWLTLPGYYDLGLSRHWHFLFAWLGLINGLIYLLYGLIGGHVWRDLVLNKDQLSLCRIGHEVVDHMRLRFPKGTEARRYNVLQKATYLLVIFVLLPMMIVTGVSMSPGLDAVFPFLPDMLGGRATARTLHFITAFSLVFFVIVHVAMVVLSGLWNNMRSMITGNYKISEEGVDS